MTKVSVFRLFLLRDCILLRNERIQIDRNVRKEYTIHDNYTKI